MGVGDVISSPGFLFPPCFSSFVVPFGSTNGCFPTFLYCLGNLHFVYIILMIKLKFTIRILKSTESQIFMRKLLNFKSWQIVFSSMELQYLKRKFLFNNTKTLDFRCYLLPISQLIFIKRI